MPVDPTDPTDTDLDGPGAGGRSGLDDLLAVFDDEVELPELRVAVPARRGAVLICDPNVAADAERYKEWQKKSRDKSWRMSRDEVGVDAVKLAGIIIANTCIRIEVNGVDTGYTFASPEFRDRIDALGPADAVRHTFGVDGHMLSAARKVSEAAGMEDTDLAGDDELDTPTPRR